MEEREMSLQWTDKLGDSGESIKKIVDILHDCFFCYDAITFPIIFWVGSKDGPSPGLVDLGKGPQRIYPAQTIAMHAECAKDLAIRILRDYHEYDQKRKDSPESMK